MNDAAVLLLHRKRTAPQSFLAQRTSEPGKQSPFGRSLESVGHAGQPSAREVFDKLLRSSQNRKHLNDINSLVHALWVIISLCLVRIDENRPEYNQTSPSLDLSPLYGIDGYESDMVRAKDGTGMLSPDCYCDHRMKFHSPAASALLVLFNRNHNYIARHLLLNNEGKKWRDPSEGDLVDVSARLLAQDDQIFEIARAINCVEFKNIVVEDFLKVLCGLSNIDGSNLDISIDLQQAEKGKGYVPTIEFSMLYSELSSLTSGKDVQAFEEKLASHLGGGYTDLSDMSPREFNELLQNFANANPNRRQWNLADIRRGSNSRFKDDDLARILYEATECSAGETGAQRIASCFRPRELNMIELARKWQAGSFNEFRKYLGLKPCETFDEWNSDPRIANAAKDLYGSIDSLELYPGLHAEQICAKSSGLCLGYTLTYALLVDLVTVIRSDPEFTTNLNRERLTLWGFEDCTTRPDNGANTWLPKLLQRNLPRNYPYNNVYSLFPLAVPRSHPPISDVTLFDQRPTVHSVHIVDNLKAITHVFKDPLTYNTIYGEEFKHLSNGYGFFLGFDDEQLHDRDSLMTLFALIPDQGALSRYGKYFRRTATSLINDKKSMTGNGQSTIDIIRDVVNATCTRWVCFTLCGTKIDDKFDATSKHEDFAALYTSIFRTMGPEHGWAIRMKAIKTAATLTKDIKEILPIPKTKANPNIIDRIKEPIEKIWEFSRVYNEMYSGGIPLTQQSPLIFLDRMVKSNRARAFRLGELTKRGHLKALVDEKNFKDGSSSEIVVREEGLEESRVIANILGLAVVISVNYAQVLSLAIDFYLDESRKKERDEIVRLSNLSDQEAQKEGANAKIMGYIREAQRLGQPLGLWRKAVKDDIIQNGNNLSPITVRSGDLIFADFGKAHLNPKDFKNPLEIDPTRETPSIQGIGLHKCPGIGFISQTMPEMFKVVFRLENLQRAKGKAGRLEKIASHPDPMRTDPMVYLDPNGKTSYFPRSLTLVFDDDSYEGQQQKGFTEADWVNNMDKKRKGYRKMMNRGMGIASTLILLLLVIYIIARLTGGIASPLSKRPPKVKNNDCSSRELWHDYSIMEFVPGSDGVTPKPIEFYSDKKKSHLLSVVGIDNKDLRMKIYVDKELKGLTSVIERNSTENCGESPNECMLKKFSAAILPIPPGKHTVTIEWADNGLIPNTMEPDMELDWKAHPKRRFKWKREICN